MKGLVLTILVISNLVVSAQRTVLLSPQKQLVVKGKEQYEKGNYVEAINALGQAIKKDSTNLEIIYYLGMAYLRSDNEERAIPYLEYYVRNYKSQHSGVLEKHKAMYRLHYVREQKKLLQAPPSDLTEPVKLPANVNSPYPDYAPVMDATGTRLYFTSRRTGGISPETAGVKEGDEDAYLTERRSSIWIDANVTDREGRKSGTK